MRSFACLSLSSTAPPAHSSVLQAAHRPPLWRPSFQTLSAQPVCVHVHVHVCVCMMLHACEGLRWLQGGGFLNSYSVKGGMLRWAYQRWLSEQLGLNVFTSEEHDSMQTQDRIIVRYTRGQTIPNSVALIVAMPTTL